MSKYAFVIALLLGTINIQAVAGSVLDAGADGVLELAAGAAESTLTCKEGGVCKFGVFSDFHLMDDYGPRSGNSLYCVKQEEQDPSVLELLRSGSPLEALTQLAGGEDPAAPTEIAVLGRVGCDGPHELADAMMQLFVQENQDEKVDFILLTGDIVRHQVSMKPYYNDYEGPCAREDGTEAKEGIDWYSGGKLGREKDCKEICGDDGECSGFDFKKDDGTCRLWSGELLEYADRVDSDPNYKCRAKHYTPKASAPQEEKDKHAKKVEEHYPRLKAIHIELQKLFTKNFPDTPVLMTFGNNDCK